MKKYILRFLRILKRKASEFSKIYENIIVNNIINHVCNGHACNDQYYLGTSGA